MSPESDRRESDEMRPEYDVRGGVRGKYYKEYLKVTNVVLLEPDVAAVFHDSECDDNANDTGTRRLAAISEKLDPASRVNDVRLSEDTLTVELLDGRTISVPPAWHPRLLDATPEPTPELAGERRRLPHPLARH